MYSGLFSKTPSWKENPHHQTLCTPHNTTTHPWVGQEGGAWAVGRLYHHMTNE